MIRKLITITAIFFILIFCAAIVQSATIATVSDPVILGDFRVITITIIADGVGGAISAEAIDLSFLYSPSISLSAGRSSWYLYFINEDPGIGEAQPDAHTVALNCSKGLVSDWIGATTIELWPDATDDLPNYWPVTEDLTIDVEDIGADNNTIISLWFGR